MKIMSSNRKYHPFLRHAVLVTLALTMGAATAEADGGTLTTPYIDPGEYDRIEVNVPIEASDHVGLLVRSGTDGGDYVIRNGGEISVKGDSTTVYGVRIEEGKNASSNLTIGGKLTVDLDNTKSTHDDKCMGIWKFAGYNAVGGGQPEDKGGTIWLNEADVTVKGVSQAIGLLAGNDIQNNSVGGGRIVVNDNLVISTSTERQAVHPVQGDDGTSGIIGRTLGLLAAEGTINLKGEQNQVDVSAGGSDGDTNREVAGIYTDLGGTVTSGEKSTVILNVRNTSSDANNRRIIYGILSGLYDQVYTTHIGHSGVKLDGATTINLDTGGRAVGVRSSIKANVCLNQAAINFLNDANARETNRIGLLTESAGNIQVNSLYVGTAEKTVQDPTKITALAASNKNDPYSSDKDLYNKSYGSAGTITVNEKKDGEVQLRGQVYSDYAGTINLNLTSATSYLYGNTDIGSNLVEGKGSTINLNVANGATWTNVQDADDTDSELTKLTVSDGGLVDMTDTTYTDTAAHPFQNIYIDDTFGGNGGGFRMDIDASTNANNSDRLYVKGTHTGTHSIWLNNINADNITDGAEGTVLVSVNDEKGQFIANDKEGSLYWNRYTLDHRESTTAGYNTDWYLAAADVVDPHEKPTTSVETALSAGSLNYFMWRDSDKLMRRMGDLRHNGEEEKGLWFRMKGTEMSYDGSAFGFKDKYLLYQLGYDKLAEKNERHTRYEGIAFSYGDGESSYHRGSGDNDSYDLSLYRTDMRSKGHYLDLVLKGSRLSNDFHAFDTEGRKISGSNDNWGLSVSAEYGRKKVLDDNGWYIEPQTQLTFGYLWGDDYTLSNGVRVEQDGMTSLVGRAGFNLGRDIDEKTNVYVKLNVLHEFLGDYDFHMSDAAGNRLRYDGDFGDTWLEYGIGAAIRVDDDTHIYFDYERSTGGDFRTNWSWNAGIRWNF